MQSRWQIGAHPSHKSELGGPGRCKTPALTEDRPELMVLDEPETSLHPDLLPPLGRLIARTLNDHR